MPRTNDFVTLRKVAGKWRTVRAIAPSTLAKNKTGSPVDGGGWADRDKDVGERQVNHINESMGRKHHGRL